MQLKHFYSLLAAGSGDGESAIPDRAARSHWNNRRWRAGTPNADYV